MRRRRKLDIPMGLAAGAAGAALGIIAYQYLKSNQQFMASGVISSTGPVTLSGVGNVVGPRPQDLEYEPEKPKSKYDKMTTEELIEEALSPDLDKLLEDPPIKKVRPKRVRRVAREGTFR